MPDLFYHTKAQFRLFIFDIYLHFNNLKACTNESTMNIRSILSACLLLAAFSPAWSQLSGTTFQEAKNSKSATWAFTYVETPGFASKKDGKVDGLVVEIMSKFAEFVEKEEGIKVKFQFKGKNPDDFPTFMQEVKTGKGGVFGLGNITITEARKKEYAFSPAFIKNISIICTHKDVPTLESMKSISTDFAGMKAVVVGGTTNEEVIKGIKAKYIPSLQIITFKSSPEALDAVIKDKKAFTNLDFTYFLAATQQNLPIKRHPVGDQSTEEFGILMPKGSDWAPLMEKFLKSGFVGSTEYRKIIATHLGNNALRLLDAVSN